MNSEEQSVPRIFEYTEEQLAEIREKARQEYLSKKHKWRQRGVWVVCISCESEHAIHIGVKKMLRGIDDGGNPIIN